MGASGIQSAIFLIICTKAQAMPNRKRSRASLVITSDQISAKEIEERIGLSGDELIEKGIRLSDRPGSKTYDHSLWKISDEVEEEFPLDAHLAALMRLLEDRVTNLEALGKVCKIEIWCFVSFEVSQCGFAFPSSLLGQIARLSCDLIFDIYSGSDN